MIFRRDAQSDSASNGSKKLMVGQYLYSSRAYYFDAKIGYLSTTTNLIVYRFCILS